MLSPDAMAQNTEVKSLSLPHNDWDFADERAKELGLPARSGRSDYFRMLVDLDRRVRFKKYPHLEDSSFRFYPETMPLAAEEQALYEAAKQEPAKKKKKH